MLFVGGTPHGNVEPACSELFLDFCVARFVQISGKQPHPDRCSQDRRRRPHITWQPYHPCVLSGPSVDLETVCVSDRQNGPRLPWGNVLGGTPSAVNVLTWLRILSQLHHHQDN